MRQLRNKELELIVNKAISNESAIVTEDSAALAFVDKYNDELRFDHTMRKWYRWDGNIWRRDDKALAFSYAREEARALSDSLEGKARFIVSKVSFAAAVEKFAQSDPRVAVTKDYWNPDRYKLGTPGGTSICERANYTPPSPPT
jgi:putative DNA primase/helicase